MIKHSTCKYCNKEHTFLRTDDGDGKIQQIGYWSKGTPFCERLKNRDKSMTPFLICDVSKEKQCGFYELKDKNKEPKFKEVIKEITKPFIIKTKQKDKPDIEISSDRFPLTCAKTKDKKAL